MYIDSHVHFWKYDKKRDVRITKAMKELQKDFLPEHLSLTLSRNDINGVVAVQADQSEVETLFLVELAKTHPVIQGVVGWVDLCNENIQDRLAYFSQFPIIKGWRHLAESQPEKFLLKADFIQGIQALQQYNYTYDLLINSQQLQEAAELVALFPEQKFVLDHCGNPEIRSKDFSDWEKNITAFAQHTNVYCKVSGLLTEANWKQWSPADFYPVLDVVFNVFGFSRVMFGSDWPVMLLSGIYVQWKSLLEKYLENAAEADKDLFFGFNAKQFYNL